MRYVDKVIKGETEFKDFITRFRPGLSVIWCENIGHCGEVTVESFYEKGPEDDYYKHFYWLTMPSNDPDKGFTDGQYSERRHEIHEKIRAGKITGRI